MRWDSTPNVKPNNVIVLTVVTAAALVAAVWLGMGSVPPPKPVPLSMTELYSSVTVRGLEYAARAKSLGGQPVRVVGYAASDPRFPDRFVLSLSRKSVCSPCAEAGDYPRDVTVVFAADNSEPSPVATDAVLVRLVPGQKVPETGQEIAVSGVLSLGRDEDPQLNYVSLARLERASWTAQN